MADEQMITLRNKKTGQVVTVPREKYQTGFSGVASDIGSSLESAPEALGNMISSIPGALKKVGRYATSNNPVETLGNLGAGGVEGVAQLLSSPQVLARYLGQKFPELGKDKTTLAGLLGIMKPENSTPYEALMNFEKNHGMAPQSDDESAVRNLGGMIFGGKGLTKLPNAASRVAALSAQQAGAGGDPIHAAILGMAGELAAKAPWKKSKIPETNTVAGNEELPQSNVESAQPNTAQPRAVPGASIGSNLNSSLQAIIPGMNITLGGLDFLPNAIKKIPAVADKAVEIAKGIPEATSNAIKKLPERAGTAASTGLDALAAATSKVPMLPSLTEALSDYIKYKSIKPETLAQRKLFKDINSEDIPMINERLEAAHRLGLSYLSPAEATLSPFEAAKQGTIGRTSSGSKLLLEKGKERTTSEGKAINNLLDTVYDAKDLDPKKAAAYEQTMQAQVPDDFIARQTQRPVIAKAIKKLESNAAYRQSLEEEMGVKLGKVKPNSFLYWDMVKRVLGDMGEKAKEQGRPTTESDILAETRRSMVKQMDDIEPEYEVARGIAERRFTRNKLEDVFDKKSMTINNFKTILGSEKKFNEIINKLKAYPEAQQKLRDMKLLFGQTGDMIHNDMNIRSAAALKRTSMSEARNKVDAMKAILDEKYGKAHDVAVVNLMTDPNWPTIFSEYLKNKGK